MASPIPLGENTGGAKTGVTRCEITNSAGGIDSKLSASSSREFFGSEMVLQPDLQKFVVVKAEKLKPTDVDGELHASAQDQKANS